MAAETQNRADGLAISVVLNTCDRRGPLRTALSALRRQTYTDFEVVVVVGPTHDDTLEMLEAEFAGSVHVARCAEFNLSVSRNVGVRHAAGDVVAFLDDDAIPAPTWLEQLAAAYFAHPHAAGVGGRTYLVAGDESESGVQFLSGLVSVLAEQDDVRWKESAPPRVVPASSTPDEFWFPRFHGTNMSYRRSALLELGGFDERFEYLFDDADSAVRFGLAGRELVQLRQGVVYHLPASGRNRGDKSRYDLNWYCWLRSTLYFALKNGAGSVGRLRSLKKAFLHTSHFYTVVSDLLRRGDIDDALRRKIHRGLRRGWVEGFWTGLFGRRRMPASLLREPRRFLPYPKQPTPLRPAMTPDSSPLRIALLSVGYPPTSTEGVARSTEILAKGLAHLGHEVHVITLGESRRTLVRETPSGDGSGNRVYVHEIRAAPRRRYATLGDDYRTVSDWLDFSHAVYDEIRDLMLNHRIQVVDTPLWNLDGLVTAVAGDLPVVVRVVTAMRQIAGFAHGEVPEQHRLLGDLEEELLRRAAAVVSNTEATARTLEAVYDFDTGDPRHAVVLYGIEPVEEAELAQDTATADGDDVTVLFVGRLESRKGILDLFDAIPDVLSRHPNVRFVVAGSDNSGHDGFQDTHGTDYPTHFARRHPKLAPRVDFLGYVPEDELHRLYRDCDLLVAPSLYESFGLIYLEAMNYARPVIGCRAGGPQEIIVDGVTGRLVPAGDGGSLGEAISDLVALGSARRELGWSGRRRLLARFTQITMAKGFEAVYRRTIERISSATRGGVSAGFESSKELHKTPPAVPLEGAASRAGEVIRMVKESLQDAPGETGTRSRAATFLNQAKKLQREFRNHPIGGKLTPAKKFVHWWTASAFDRQAKAVEALMEAMEELVGAESVSRVNPEAQPRPKLAVNTPAAGTPAAGTPAAGTPESLSRIREVRAEMQISERLVLYSLVYGLRPARSLEIGTFQGGSAALICSALRDLGSGCLVCVDPSPKVLAENARFFDNRATVLTGASPEVLEEALQAAGGLFDFVLVDGDHSTEGVLRDIEGVLPYLADEAHLLFHDCHYAYVRDAIGQALLGHPNHLADAGVISTEQKLTDEIDERGVRVIWGGLRLLRFSRRMVGPG